MTLFKSFALGGPLGMAHALREAWIAHRIRQVSTHMDQERELHREHTAQLRHEMKTLLMRQVEINQRATSFWRSLP